MPRIFRVAINLPLVVANLSRADREAHTEASVRQWLRDAGFTPDGDHWLVREPDLGQIDPSEVFSAEVLSGGGGDEEDGDDPKPVLNA